MPTVSVIVTNWNGKQFLEACFNALNAQTCRDFEVILVDDASDDGSADWVAEQFPNICLIRQTTHLGFAAVNNIGIQAARGKYIVTLNNDTRPEPDWLAELAAGVSAADVGMVASQMLVWDRPDTLDSAGIEVDWAGFGWNRGWGKQAGGVSEPEDVFGPCAGAALYRREMLDEIGLFDEEFYAYYEDVDLAWRAQRAGWRCRYAPSARVLHRHSATGNKFAHRKARLLSRNKIWAIFKNYPWPDILWAWPLILMYDILSAAHQTIRLRSFAPLQGRLQAIKAARQMIGKRLPPVCRVRLSKPRLIL